MIRQSVTFKADDLPWMRRTRLALRWFITFRDCLEDARSFEAMREAVLKDIEDASEYPPKVMKLDTEEGANFDVELAIARTLADAMQERIDTLLKRKA